MGPALQLRTGWIKESEERKRHEKFFNTFILIVVILFSSAITNLETCQGTDIQEPSSIEKGKRENLAGQVIFYSRTGNTRIVAKVIGETFGLPLQEIKDLKDRSGFFGFIGGMIDVRKNPITTISPETFNLEGYKVLFIGSPIWGMKFAPAITTFLERTDFSGKTVILFTTTSSRMKESTFDEYSEIIQAKGGTVIDFFFLKTLWKESEEIRKEAQELVKIKTESWMEKIKTDEPQ
jgi:flavodoxin